jgi:signal peptidase II
VTTTLGVCCLVVLAVDQAAKTAALTQARTEPQRFPAWIIRVRLVRTKQARVSRLAVIWAFAAVASLVSTHTPMLDGALAPSGLGLALGGAASNLVDRAFRGAVVDMIDVRVWPVFNPADVAIVAGLALAFWPV